MDNFNQLPCPVLITDAFGLVLAANAELLTLISKTAAEVEQKPMDDLFPPVSRIFLQTHVWTMLRHEDCIKEIYIKMYDAKNQKTPVMLNCKKGDFNGVDSYFWVFFVAIERAKFEVELLNARRHEHDKNELLNKQVNHMQKIESIGRLTAGIAHDFNNILACMLGYNELNQFISEDLTDESLKVDFEKNTKQIAEAGQRAVALIAKMMTYCRQDPKKEKMNVQSTEKVIEEALAMLLPALTRRIKIEAEFNCDSTIQIDAIDLHQILTNLAVNARDAMKERGGVITIALNTRMNLTAQCEACAVTLDGNFIELSITDNGTGIAPHVIKRMFDPFFTTKPQGEGTGLGLSTVIGMVHSSHGHVVIESKCSAPNQGTTFRLLFPIQTKLNDGVG